MKRVLYTGRIPVSYTHLDVYKRQNEYLKNQLSHISVSYTHLDVYKRQTLGYSLTSFRLLQSLPDESALNT